MTDSRLPNLTSNFRDFFGFKNLSPRRSRESGVGGFFRGKESGVGKARESESGVGVGNSVNRLPSPAGRRSHATSYTVSGSTV